MPFQATEMSACFDLCACLHTEMVSAHGRNVGVPVENFGGNDSYVQIMPGELLKIPTGLIFIIPPMYHIEVYHRSGNVWNRRLGVANSPGIIDADYTLETFVLLENKSPNAIVIRNGMGIAQGQVVKNTDVGIITIDDHDRLEDMISAIKNKSSRDGGFGSTG